MRSESSKGVARLQLFSRKAQEIYDEMLSRGLCSVGDEIVIFGGPKSSQICDNTLPKTRDGSDFRNGIRTWANQDDPKRLLTVFPETQP